MSEAPKRPVMRYHGGKWMLAPWIVSTFPAHRVYVEPFGGAASVLMRKPRCIGEVYNDLNGEVVNLFRVLRDRPSALFRALRRTPYSRQEHNESFDPTDDPIEQARRLVVRAATGFGTNNLSERKGFRSYTGKLRHGLPVDDFTSYPRAVAALSRRLRGVIIENTDARAVLVRHDGDDTLHYCDPPYVHATRRVMREGHVGYQHELTDADHEALAATLRGLSGMVVLSGYASPLYERLYGDWVQVSRPTMADGAKPRVEVLWLNQAAAQGRFKLEASGADAARAGGA